MRVTRAAPGSGAAACVVSLSAQIVFTSLVFAAGTWHWSDVPWSHFFAAFLAVGFYALRFAPRALEHAVVSAFAGAVLALLALTRSFEFMAVVVAGRSRSACSRCSGFTLGGAASAELGVRRAARSSSCVAAVYAVDREAELFLLYESGSRRALRRPAPRGGRRRSRRSTSRIVPLKVVQLFLDPCFYSLCSLHEYAGIRAAWSGSLPLAVQLPALLLIPLCVVAVGLLVVRAPRRTPRPASRAARASSSCWPR